MKTIDLHVHSTFSDGTLTPGELVSRAIKYGLSAMALTDHDTIEGIDEAICAGKTQGLEIVSGIELSTFYNHREIHILGLYIDYTDEHFKKELENLRLVRRNRNLLMCSRFEELGMPISYEEMEKKYAGAVITRAHFADYLLEKGYIKSRNEAFERYIGANGPCYVARKKMAPEEAIDLIKAAKGVPILAHPLLYHLGNDQLRALVNHLCSCGICGLEAIYSTYTMGEELQMKRLAKENHLIISGGSDYHGANKPYLEIGIGRGHLCVPYSVLEDIKALRG